MKECLDSDPLILEGGPIIEISKGKEEFASLFRKGEVLALTSFYTDDARILPPNSTPIQGREAIRVFWQSLIELGIEHIQMETPELDIVQDTVIEVSNFKLIGSRFSVVDQGNHITIWKREADGWKISKDIFNSAQPAQ